MAEPIRRSHARIHCDRPVEVFAGAIGSRRLGAGRLLNASMSGAYLSFAGELKPATPYRLRADGLEEPLDLPFRVAREGPSAAGARNYGLVFNLSGDQERRLRQFLDVLRRQPSADKESPLERSLRNYWES